MIQEEHAEGIVYDATSDKARITTGLRPEARAPADVELLLDGNGFLVGVDMGGGEMSRVVVMLGPHEAVAKVTSARVEVARDAKGHVAEITIEKARGAIQAAGRSPYFRE